MLEGQINTHIINTAGKNSWHLWRVYSSFWNIFSVPTWRLNMKRVEEGPAVWVDFYLLADPAQFPKAHLQLRTHPFLAVLLHIWNFS